MTASNYAIAHGLSEKQENILCDIQKAFFEGGYHEYVSMLPDEVKQVAKKADVEFRSNGVTELAKELDNQLIELVKKYWNADGKLNKLS